MSFSGEVREELLQIIPGPKHCRKAELFPYLAHLVSVSEEDGEILVSVTADNALLLRKIFTLIRKTLIITNVCFEEARKSLDGLSAAAENAAQKTVPGRKRPYTVSFRANDETDRDMLALIREAAGERTIPERSCCRRCLLRGYFLLYGSVNDPAKSYHLEFAVREPEEALYIAALLGEEGIEAHVSARGKMALVYVNESNSIVDLLGMMGASGGLMAYENSLILKEIANSVNRRVNCETSNLMKTVEASERQIRDILFLQEQGVLETLPRSLRETAEARLANTELSLTELGEMFDPPVGKSGINHRLRKLSEKAEALRKLKGIHT